MSKDDLSDDDGATLDWCGLLGLDPGLVAPTFRTLQEAVTRGRYVQFASPAMGGRAGERAWLRYGDEVLRSGVRFLAGILATRTDPESLALLAETVEDLANSDDCLRDQGYAFETLKFAVAALPGTHGQLAELAGSRHQEVRMALAKGLDPLDDAARAHLFTLAADPVGSVRDAAKATLQGFDLPWWLGHFEQDPLRDVTEAERETLAEVLIPLAEQLRGRSRALRRDPSSLVPLLARLPGRLVAELVPRLMDPLALDTQAPLLAALLAHPEGEDALARWLAAHEDDVYAHIFARAVAGLGDLPAPRRRELALRSLRRIVAGERGGDDDLPTGDDAEIWALVVQAAWPPDDDPYPIVEAALGIDAAGVPHPVGMMVASALQRAVVATRAPSEAREPLMSVLLAARRAGWDGAWRWVHGIAEAWLDRVGASWRRGAALDAVASDLEGQGLTYALVDLAGPAYVEAEDGPLELVLAGWVHDERLRKALLGHPELPQRGLPTLRMRLRHGLADSDEAIATLRAIDACYGGLAATETSVRNPEAWHAWHPETELRGPITAREWEIFRALRRPQLAEDLLSEDPHELHVWAQLIPPGPWDPEDRRVALRRYENMKRENPRFGQLALAIFRAKAQPEDAALLAGAKAGESADGDEGDPSTGSEET